MTRALRIVVLLFALSISANGEIASVNGVQLYYEVQGQGSPLLLLHHFTGSGEVWAPFVPEFAKSFQVIVIDLRGHGRSTNPSGQFTHRQSALDVFALLDQLGIKQCKAIGTSTGGMTLLHMATQQPSRVEAMILVGATDQFGPEARAMMRTPDCETLTPKGWERMRALHKHGDAQILALQRQFCGFKDSYDDMNFTPPLLSTITARTLVIHGDRDIFFPVRIPVEMYTSIPLSYLWIVPNGGHLPIFSNRDEFMRLALDFLKGSWDKPTSVSDVHQKRFRLMTQNDLDALAPLLADDLVYIHTSGEMESKQQFLERLRSGAIRYRSIEPSETVIRTSGDTATVTGRAKMAVTSGGADRQFEIRYTAVYRSTGGRWQLVSWQSTRIQ